MPPDRHARALLSLDGLSVGDAFAQHALRAPDPPARVVATRRAPPAPWRFSDDTAMAQSVVEVLAARDALDQDALAAAFARRFSREPERGYGAVAHWILARIAAGDPWRTVARTPFSGTGSMGNGAAMRVAPVGAWFADDEREAVRSAIASAEVTHAHPEGQAGAAAVAAAAVFAWRARRAPREAGAGELLAFATAHTPAGETHRRLREAAKLLGAKPERAASVLGDGTEVTAPDTVPYALWCASTSLGDYADAQWRALAGLLGPAADRDTVCAIVGGVVALAAGRESIPPAWLAAREPLGD